MRTMVKFKKEFRLITEMINDSKFQVFEHEYLKGANDIYTARGVKYLLDAGIKLKQVRISLDNSSVKLKDELLSYIKGDVSSKAKKNSEDFWKINFWGEKNKDESTNIINLEGQGEIVLKADLGHFTLIELEDEEIIIDEDIFCGCEEDIDLTEFTEKNANSIILDEDGISKIKLKGNGIVLLKLEVSEDEIMRVKIYNDKLYLKDEVEILRTHTIKHNIEDLNYSLKKDDISTQKLVDMYNGIGEVWLLPTKSIYDYMKNIDYDNELYQEDNEIE